MAPAERHFRFVYTTTIAAAQCAERDVRVWIPVPASDRHQAIRGVEITSPIPYDQSTDAETGNRMLHLTVPQGTADTQVVVRFEVARRTRHEVCPPEDSAHTVRLAPEVEAYLAPDSKVPLTGPAVDGARGLTSLHDPPVVRARKIFSFVMDFLEYDMSGCTPEKQHELGNLAHACDLKRGTCTDFHGLFVSCARALGLPARFAFGFNVPAGKVEGRVAGYHCWAEVFLPRVGWFPVDITEALKRRMRGTPQAEIDFFFGGLNPDRVQLSAGRDVTLAPAAHHGRLDKFIFSYAEHDGGTLDPGVNFSFQDTST